MKDLSYNQRIKNAGINIIYPDGYNPNVYNKKIPAIYLEYMGKKIVRPNNPENSIHVIKREFNLDI